MRHDRVDVQVRQRIRRRVTPQSKVVQRHHREPGHAPRLAQLRSDRHRRAQPRRRRARPGERIEIDDVVDPSPPRGARVAAGVFALLPAEPVAVVLKLADVGEVLEIPDIHRPAAHAVVGQVQRDQQLDQPVVVGAEAGIGVSPEAGCEPLVQIDPRLNLPAAGVVLLLQGPDPLQRAADVPLRRPGQLARQIPGALNERVAQPIEQELILLQLLLIGRRGGTGLITAEAEEPVQKNGGVGLDERRDAVDGAAIAHGIKRSRVVDHALQRRRVPRCRRHKLVLLRKLRPPQGGRIGQRQEHVARREHLDAVAAGEGDDHRTRQGVLGQIAEER